MFGGAVGSLLSAPTAWANDDAFSFEDMTDRAAEDAKRPYRDTRTLVPDYWTSISFDDYRKINFDGENAVWRGDTDFEIQLFHLGLYYDHAIKVNEIVDGRSEPLHYSPDMFNFGTFEPDEPLPDIGFSGFRVHYPLNTPRYHDEFAVFQGASYFRLIGRGHGYGQSARGLAIDTASTKGEEFPYFSEFWLEKPSPDAVELTVYARLDSPSCTGAFRFVIHPRTESQMDVRARIFPRRPIDKLGVAPLTSMFLFGENSERRFDDFRPEVHDTDGLMIHSGFGEWIWRPLADRKSLTVSSYGDNSVRGFG
ncbi:MAG: glucan biosynthesis protein, partial [Pseudomonadota bacterium]